MIRLYLATVSFYDGRKTLTSKDRRTAARDSDMNLRRTLEAYQSRQCRRLSEGLVLRAVIS